MMERVKAWNQPRFKSCILTWPVGKSHHFSELWLSQLPNRNNNNGSNNTSHAGLLVCSMG